MVTLAERYELHQAFRGEVVEEEVLEEVKTVIKDPIEQVDGCDWDAGR